MKVTGKCPKCGGDQVVRCVNRFMKEEPVLRGGAMDAPIPIDHYVCRSCGYVEQWISSEDLNSRVLNYREKQSGK